MRFPVGLVTPCVGVWIETLYDAFIAGEAVSHPAWVCGLKLNIRYSGSQRTQSHPAWVCGLKLGSLRRIHYGRCHTLRGCVD